MTHPFDAYREKHERQPSISVVSGVQRLTVEFHRGYVHIRASSPYSGEVYITRTAFLTLLRKVVPIARVWAKHPAPNWDVPQRMTDYLAQEREMGAELARQKRERRRTLDDQRAAEKQQRRWQMARARAARKSSGAS